MRVHVQRPIEGPALTRLEAALDPGLTLTQGDQPPPEASYTVLVAGRPTPELLAASPQLDTLRIPFAGLPAEVREPLLAHPGLAVHNLHFNAAATAEMALALLLSAAKRLVPADRALRQGDWRPRYDALPALQLAGRTVCVLGYGAIGQRVARACAAMGMRVLGVRRTADGQGDGVAAAVHPLPDLPAVLARSQVLIVCLPDTPATRGLIGADELALLPADALVVNVGRGPVIDAQALHEALTTGGLFGAGLDVWWSYPKDEEARASTQPAEQPFGELDQVVLSPHRGGTVNDTEVRRAEALAEVLNLRARGEPLPHPVDLEAGY
jgi:phosphoglycerate dehydrogenase-like enzyme